MLPYGQYDGLIDERLNGEFDCQRSLTLEWSWCYIMNHWNDRAISSDCSAEKVAIRDGDMNESRFEYQNVDLNTSNYHHSTRDSIILCSANNGMMNHWNDRATTSDQSAKGEAMKIWTAKVCWFRRVRVSWFDVKLYDACNKRVRRIEIRYHATLQSLCCVNNRMITAISRDIILYCVRSLRDSTMTSSFVNVVDLVRGRFRGLYQRW